jgi:hypothetical protein
MSKINKKNIISFIQGNTRMLAKELGEITRFPLLAVHIQEQVLYRKSLCEDCLLQEKCMYCGCSVPGKLYSTKTCGSGRWGDLLPLEEWEIFKIQNNIVIKLETE